MGPESLSQVSLYTIAGCCRSDLLAHGQPEPRWTLTLAFYEKEKLFDRVPSAFSVQFPELSGPQDSLPFRKRPFTFHTRPVAKCYSLRTDPMSSLLPPSLENVSPRPGLHPLAESVFPLSSQV